MQFSYSLLKKIVPQLPAKRRLIDKLNLHVFEAEASAADLIEISLPANRYSDASSYWGLAKIIGAILKLDVRLPRLTVAKTAILKKVPVVIQDSAFCRRLTARYIAGVKIGPSPKWLKDVLAAHGMHSINNLVDVTNYVMLETGQPTHVFDFDKMAGGRLVVRRAKNGELIETLDRKKFKLSRQIHVLADAASALDIAGIKGGTQAELTARTKNVLLTAGNFNGVTIYNTARAINLKTDASARFSHELSPELASIGSDRATQLILELCGGRAGPRADVFPKSAKPRVIAFDIDRFNRLIGVRLTAPQAAAALRRLGFKITGRKVMVPELRPDVTTFEDLAEEVANLYGYNNIAPQAPAVLVRPPQRDFRALIRGRAKNILAGLGCDEVYNYSFVSRADLEKTGGLDWWRAVALENPLSESYAYLRPSLMINLQRAAENNLRFFDIVRIFEVGRNFSQSKGALIESRALGLALAAKSANPLLVLKGLVSDFLNQLGLRALQFSDPEFSLPHLRTDQTIFVKSGDTPVGYLGSAKDVRRFFVALAEFDLEKIEARLIAEKEYAPIPRQPTVARDISLYAEASVRVGDLLAAIQKSASQILRTVDLVDYFAPQVGHKRSLLFRLVFQAEHRTLTDTEVNQEMAKIEHFLAQQFRVQIR